MYVIGDRYKELHKMLNSEMSPAEIDKVLFLLLSIIQNTIVSVSSNIS